MCQFYFYDFYFKLLTYVNRKVAGNSSKNPTTIVVDNRNFMGGGSMIFRQVIIGFVSMVCILDPIFSATFAWSIFSETLSFYNLVGFAVVLVGLYLTTYSQCVVKQ